MIFTFLIALIGILGLLILHEFGHFIVAKKCGVEVQEFGVGYPPRIFGKKVGETIYSLNLIPFGAFVSIKGEMGGVEDLGSFSGKPMWQRMAIVLGGVVSFWIVSAFLLGIVSGVWGLPTAVSDEIEENLVDPKVNIVGIMEGSPAEKSGLKAGDIIEGLEKEGEEVKVDKVSQVQSFISSNPEKEISLFIKRGKEKFKISSVPRPSEKGAILGFVLTRVALKPYPWYKAPFQGIKATGILTANIVEGWILAVKKAFGLAELPPGVKFELMGPLGIFDLLGEYFNKGVNYFLYLLALVAVALALANSLPIPALDGGKIIFLAVEAVRRKPIPKKFEQRVTAIFFIALILLMAYITLKFDIPRVFF
jgi:regulator of sigma E protease